VKPYIPCVVLAALLAAPPASASSLPAASLWLADGTAHTGQLPELVSDLTPEQEQQTSKREAEKWQALAHETGIPQATLANVAGQPETRIYLLTGGEIHSVDTKGKDQKKVPTAGSVVHFAVNPSQDRLLYVTGEQRDDAVVFKLYTSNVDGAAPRLLTDRVGDPNLDRFGGTGNPLFSHCGGPAYPHWSSDGRRILYSGWRDTDGSVPFYVVDVLGNTSEEKLVLRVPGPTRIADMAAPAESMSKHPFAIRAIDERASVYGTRGFNVQLDPDGGAQIGAAPPRPGPVVLAWYCSDVRWHPDGKSLTWTADASADTNALWVRDLTGFDTSSAASLNTAAQRLPRGEQFLWAPNGEHVVVSRLFQDQGRMAVQVFIAERKSGQVTVELFREPTGGVTGPKVRLLAWSPDSSKVAVYVSHSMQANQIPTGSIKIFDLASPSPSSPLEVASGRIPPLSLQASQFRRAGFSADSKTFYFIHVALASTPGLPIAQSVVEAVTLASRDSRTTTEGHADRPNTTPVSPPQAPVELYQQSGSILAIAMVEPHRSGVEVPDLPLLIPTAELDGSIKQKLMSLRDVVQNELAKAKGWSTGRRQAEAGEPFDSLKLLQKWYDGNAPILEAEQSARANAEDFFKQLATTWDRMNDAERTRVENGLLDRALALRRYRTVQRGVVRKHAGMGTIASGPDLNTYYDAVARVTWAAQELEALARMWGFINTARLISYDGYDVYELRDPRKDPTRVAAIEKARRRHFEALIDIGLAATLASESSYEAVLDARKSRLYSFKEWWKDSKQDFSDPFVARGATGLSIQLASAGLNVLATVEF